MIERTCQRCLVAVIPSHKTARAKLCFDCKRDYKRAHTQKQIDIAIRNVVAMYGLNLDSEKLSKSVLIELRKNVPLP